MSAQQQPPKVTSEIGSIRAAGNIAPIEAAYYTLTDRDGRAQAGFVVLLDSLARPVRAELHIYDDLDISGREQLARQAQQVLQQRYYARQPVPLRIYDSQLDAHPITVDMPTDPPAGVKSSARRKRSSPPVWLWALIALVPLVILLWLGFQFFGGNDAASTPTDTTSAATDAAADTADGTGTDDTGADATPVNTGTDLPPSVNARSDIATGMRVRIVPGLQAFLLDQPDAVNGVQIGAIADGQEMTVRDGPVMRRGTSDTIVWWYVVTDDGTEGWAPANTSELTLLVPVN
ncbi:MAG: hypothetical protein H6644_08350 [Caldilineaceae bacterium]|nr:hypothetical protein [Caldilineaceae bacterium]